MRSAALGRAYTHFAERIRQEIVMDVALRRLTKLALSHALGAWYALAGCPVLTLTRPIARLLSLPRSISHPPDYPNRLIDRLIA